MPQWEVFWVGKPGSGWYRWGIRVQAGVGGWRRRHCQEGIEYSSSLSKCGMAHWFSIWGGGGNVIWEGWWVCTHAFVHGVCVLSQFMPVSGSSPLADLSLCPSLPGSLPSFCPGSPPGFLCAQSQVPLSSVYMLSLSERRGKPGLPSLASSAHSWPPGISSGPCAQTFGLASWLG